MAGLEVRGLQASYGQTLVLKDIEFNLPSGGILAVLGANGAGKTTLLRALMQAVTVQGEVSWQGQSLMGLSTESIVAQGVAHVAQGRGTLGSLTVAENLRLGAWCRRDGARAVKADVTHWLDAMPELGAHRHQLASSLSGGEQQLLALARAMMMRPRLMLLDEPSLGLAPRRIAQVYAVLRDWHATRGLTLLLVEQSATLALDLAQEALVLQQGRVVCSGVASTLRSDPALWQAYLGGAGA